MLYYTSNLKIEAKELLKKLHFLHSGVIMKRFTISIFFISFFFFACSESNSSSANESEKENSEPQESVLETFTDERDGQEYKYIKIGNQTWMAENLNYETEDSYCYDEASANCEKYGRLYAWGFALEVCPD